MLLGPDMYLCLALNKGFTGYLKSSAGYQVTRKMLSHKVGVIMG
jgi:hypothetical protein